jgi:hypothetical protein
MSRRVGLRLGGTHDAVLRSRRALLLAHQAELGAVGYLQPFVQRGRGGDGGRNNRGGGRRRERSWNRSCFGLSGDIHMRDGDRCWTGLRVKLIQSISGSTHSSELLMGSGKGVDGRARQRVVGPP